MMSPSSVAHEHLIRVLVFIGFDSANISHAGCQRLNPSGSTALGRIRGCSQKTAFKNLRRSADQWKKTRILTCHLKNKALERDTEKAARRQPTFTQLKSKIKTCSFIQLCWLCFFGNMYTKRMSLTLQCVLQLYQRLTPSVSRLRWHVKLKVELLKVYLIPLRSVLCFPVAITHTVSTTLYMLYKQNSVKQGH